MLVFKMTNGKYHRTRLYDEGTDYDNFHPISKIVDRWIDRTGEIIGYVVEYVGYEGQSWFVRIDHLDAPLLIREFERVNRNAPKSSRKGVHVGHGFGYPIGSFDVRGEFYSFCEGYPSHACSLIALNVHMKRRLWERFEEFEESLVDYKDKKVLT